MHPASGLGHGPQQGSDDFVSIHAIGFSLSVSAGPIRETSGASHGSQQRSDDFVCIYAISFSLIREQQAVAQHIRG